MKTLIITLGWWGIVGYFWFCHAPVPEGRLRALIHLFFAGPMVWAMAIIYAPFRIKKWRGEE